MKNYTKKKEGPKKGPKYRTPSHFAPRKRLGGAGKGANFIGRGNTTTVKFNPSTFKVQHRG